VTPNLGSEMLGSFHSFYAINPNLLFTSRSLHQFWYQSFRSDCFFKQSRSRNTVASSQSLLLFRVTHPKIHCHHTTTTIYRPTFGSHHTNHGSSQAATNRLDRTHHFFYPSLAANIEQISPHPVWPFPASTHYLDPINSASRSPHNAQIALHYPDLNDAE
jgi:hypothetical protein